MPGSIRLFSSRQNGYVQITVCRKTRVAFWLPLPARPDAKDQDWTPWTTEGVEVQRCIDPERRDAAASKPPPKDYAFRVRVQRESVAERRDQDWKASQAEARMKFVDSLSPNDPLERWLDLFEPGSIQGDTTFILGSDPLGRGLEAVKTKMAEFPAVLNSSDRMLVRRALKALSLSRGDIPRDLIPSIGVAGRQVANFVHAARAASQPGDPDAFAEHEAYDFFLGWNSLMRDLGANAAAAGLSTLEEIAADVKEENGGDLGKIAHDARQDIHSLKGSGAAAKQP